MRVPPGGFIHPHFSRRTAIQAGAVGLLGLGTNHLAGLREARADGRDASQRAVIYIFLSGGLGQHDSERQAAIGGQAIAFVGPERLGFRELLVPGLLVPALHAVLLDEQDAVLRGHRDHDHRGAGIGDHAATPAGRVRVRGDQRGPLGRTPGCRGRGGRAAPARRLRWASPAGRADGLRERQFAPLGLASTIYCDTRPIIKHRAQGYVVGPDRALMNAPPLSMGQPFSAGSLCSTVGEPPPGAAGNPPGLV